LRPNDEAAGIRMSMAAREAPVRKCLDLGGCGVSFRRSCLERPCDRIVVPRRPPKYDPMILEPVMRRLIFDRNGRDLRVIPDECPDLFCVNLSLGSHPVGNALRFAAHIPRREVVENVVVRPELPVDTLPF